MAFCVRSKLSAFKNHLGTAARWQSAAILPQTASLLASRTSVFSPDAPAAAPCLKALHTSAPRPEDNIDVHIETEYQTVTLKGAEGDSILTIIKKSEYAFEGFGACDGTATCSTCHVYFDEATYDAVNKGISDEEQDMLYIVEDRKPTSRLGCQVKLTKKLDGMTVILPLVNP